MLVMFFESVSVCVCVWVVWAIIASTSNSIGSESSLDLPPRQKFDENDTLFFVTIHSDTKVIPRTKIEKRMKTRQ